MSSPSKLLQRTLMMLIFTALLVGLVAASTPDNKTYVWFPEGKIQGGTSESSPTHNSTLDVRLPKSLKPLHYVVKLQPLINDDFSILGYVEVEVEVLESTSNITLHMADIITKNETAKVSLSGDPSSPAVNILRQRYDPLREFYTVDLEGELEEGKTYVFSVEFVGYLNDKLHGFYRSTYKTDDGEIRFVATTQFQATDARRAFPCFDEPSLKATFEVFLAREEWMTSISNMPLAETLPIAGQSGWVWDRFEKSVPMSTYLVAFLVSDFSHVTTTMDDRVQFRVWARESVINQTEYANDIGPRMLSFFEDYFNLTFPLPKQDMVALPDFTAGAMENWGLINYREPYLLYQHGVTTPENKEFLATTVSHELAHQWFGNLVTPEWWDDLWLNEGFATYLSYLGTDHVEPTWKAMETSVIKSLMSVFEKDSLESSHRISIPVTHPDEINEIFDDISYDKGASIIRMMNHYLSEPTFTKGLQNFLKAFVYKNARQDDLWEHLTLAAHEDGTLPEDVSVKMIMDTWTLQKGYPVIDVKRSLDGTSAIVVQSRFVTEKNSSRNELGYRWWVPITYTSKSEADFNQTQPQVWLRASEANLTIASLPFKDEWVIFNLQETGYYRVNYDNNNWNLLIDQLRTDHKAIHTINRAQLIDDAMSLAKAGKLSYRIAIGIYSYLWKEMEFLPWSVGVNQLSYVENIFRHKSDYGALKNFILDLVLPLYKAVGFEDNVDDPYLEQAKRRIAVRWACEMGYRDCIDRAVDKYHRWMQDPKNESIISPNLRKAVYCSAIAEGGEAEWNFAWKRFLQSQIPSEKVVFIKSLACTKKTWLLSRYLEMVSTNTGIAKGDETQVLISIGINSFGRPLVLDYFKKHWNDMLLHMKCMRGTVLKNVASRASTLQDLHMVEQIVTNTRNDMSGNEIHIHQVSEAIRNNIRWLKDNYDDIVNTLEEKGYSSKLKIL